MVPTAPYGAGGTDGGGGGGLDPKPGGGGGGGGGIPMPRVCQISDRDDRDAPVRGATTSDR
jgi:hypothetical protein